MNLNERLARAMGFVWVVNFSYTNPAITMECLKWLHENGYITGKDSDGMHFVEDNHDCGEDATFFVEAESLEEAICLAYCEAKESRNESESARE